MSTQNEPRRFPPDFQWGVATSSYQIEGAVEADGRSPSIWDTFCVRPGAIADGSTGAIANDHYHRYREDIAIMKQLGVNAYRFSIAWPRILPDGRGRVNQAGVDFYERLVDSLLEQGIEPYATLYHWDMPQVQHDRTPWYDRGVVDAFVEYTDVITRRLSDRVKYWMTLNEPWVISFLGYGAGEHAPGLRDKELYLRAAHHVLLAHGKAMPVIRANGNAQTKAGIVLNLNWVNAASDSPEDQAAARRYDQFFNRWFAEPLYNGRYPEELLEWYGRDLVPVQPGDFDIITTPTDFLAVNYYARTTVKAGSTDPMLQVDFVRPPGEYTAMDWEVYPQGLYNILNWLHTDYAPPALYVTENGAAYDDQVSAAGEVDDPQRLAYLEGHFEAAYRAIQAGIPLKGYFVWSLMDNFEWGRGFEKRFGIVFVDYATQQRIIKRSGKWFSQVTRANGLPAPQTT